MIRWFGDIFMSKVDIELSNRIEKAGEYVRDYIKNKLNVPVSYAQDNVGVITGRSAPGEYPRRQFGDLRKSIFAKHNRRRKESTIGTDLDYGKFLEIGTRKMRRRPWLSMGFREALPGARAIIQGGTPI